MKKANEKVQTSESKTAKSEVANVMPKPTALDKKTYKSLSTSIDRELKKVESSYLNVATTLYRIYKNEYYVIDNYKNIYDYASDLFGLSRGTVSNFINIVYKFCKPLDDGSYCLVETYNEFSSSQLVSLINMPQQFIDSITPDMSVRAIKDKRREYKQLISETADSDIIDTEFTESDDTSVSSESSKKKQDKLEKFPNPCFVFETDDYTDFFNKEKIAVIEDAFKDFEKSNKGKKVRFRLFLEV